MPPQPDHDSSFNDTQDLLNSKNDITISSSGSSLKDNFLSKSSCRRQPEEPEDSRDHLQNYLLGQNQFDMLNSQIPDSTLADEFLNEIDDL